MMMSFVAYAIALLSCVNGISHFIFKAIKQHSFPIWWQWLILFYSFGQVAVPFIYFYVLDLR